MQRITIRWMGALAAALGIGGVATAQYTPAIPQAQQTAGFSPNAPWMSKLPGVAASTQPSGGQELVQVQAVGQQPATPPAPKTGTPATQAGPALPAIPTAPSSFPYTQPRGAVPPPPPTVATAQPPVVPPYQPTPFGTYGAPPQPRNLAFGAGMAPVPYGYFEPNCANGCGSLKSDLSNLFGSCKTFFNPCGPIPCNCNKGDGSCSTCAKHGLWNKCPAFPYGTPYGRGCNMCAYDSYLNK